MPGWKGILSEEDIRAVAAYIKTFSRRFEREKPAPMEGTARVESSPESIARGRDIYDGAEAECIKCHGNSGRGDGPSADELTEDAFGDVIVPADLSMPWLFRGGPSVEDIHMRLMTGVTGTPMPAFSDVLSPEDLWHVANYVDSLGNDTPGEVDPVIRAAYVEGDLPDQPASEGWQAAPETYYPLFGQMMAGTRNYSPSIQGVWVRALYNDREIALLVRWHDRFPDAGLPDAGQDAALADAFAVQLPAELPEGDERPYFVFGDQAHPVNLWTWNGAASTVSEDLAQGVGTQAAQETQNLQGSAAYSDGEYTLVLRRDLQTGDEQDLQFELGRFIPIAFIASDGWRDEDLASGAISSWFSIYLEKPVAAVTYAWIPAAAGLTILLEALTVWSVRRRARQQEPAMQEPAKQDPPQVDQE
jgi:DMSO reductase family type II enzyme heme b subunit